ncbi:hypothetical protein ACFXTH_004686 [Malus domestica]
MENVKVLTCVAGNSSGAGFALQLGMELAKQEIYVETHAFNPPCVSLPRSPASCFEETNPFPPIPILSGLDNLGVSFRRWVPNIYSNKSDSLCCSCADHSKEMEGSNACQENVHFPTPLIFGKVGVKMFETSEENQNFMVAHLLAQWWMDDLELQTFSPEIISRKLTPVA